MFFDGPAPNRDGFLYIPLHTAKDVRRWFFEDSHLMIIALLMEFTMRLVREVEVEDTSGVQSQLCLLQRLAVPRMLVICRFTSTDQEKVCF